MSRPTYQQMLDEGRLPPLSPFEERMADLIHEVLTTGECRLPLGDGEVVVSWKDEQ